MKQWSSQMIQSLRLSLLEWRFRRGGDARTAPALEGSGRYEEVEEICLRRGQRSYRVVRKLVEEA